MSLDRRAFVTTAASLTAVALTNPTAAVALPDSHHADDPLGVRRDFPIVEKRVFLNSAYIAPIPRQVRSKAVRERFIRRSGASDS